MFETVKPESKRSFLSSNFSFWMMDCFFIILLRFLIWNSVGRHDMWKKKEKFTSFFKWKKYIYWENFFFRKYHSHRNSWKCQKQHFWFLISVFEWWMAFLSYFWGFWFGTLLEGMTCERKRRNLQAFLNEKNIFTEKIFFLENTIHIEIAGSVRNSIFDF